MRMACLLVALRVQWNVNSLFSSLSFSLLLLYSSSSLHPQQSKLASLAHRELQMGFCVSESENQYSPIVAPWNTHQFSNQQGSVVSWVGYTFEYCIYGPGLLMKCGEAVNADELGMWTEVQPEQYLKCIFIVK